MSEIHFYTYSNNSNNILLRNMKLKMYVVVKKYLKNVIFFRKIILCTKRLKNM